jgi:Fic family protein
MSSIITDKSVSAQAKCFYLFIKQVSGEGVSINAVNLSKLSGYSRNTVLSYLKELKSCGYIDMQYVKTVSTRGGANVVYACTDK